MFRKIARRSFPALFAASLFVSTIARADSPPPIADVLAKLDATRVHTLKGDFRQVSRVKLFQKELVSTGRFSYVAPTTLRWEYLTPDPSVLTLDGHEAKLSTSGAPPQIFDLDSDRGMRAVFDQILAWLSGHLQPGGDYKITNSGTLATPTLILEPQPNSAAAKSFARIELHFAGDPLLLASLVITEKNGDEKRITFHVTAR